MKHLPPPSPSLASFLPPTSLHPSYSYSLHPLSPLPLPLPYPLSPYPSKFSVQSHLGSIVDLILQVRELNFYRDWDMTPFGQLQPQCHIGRCWTQLLERSSFSDRRIKVDNFNKWVTLLPSPFISVCPSLVPRLRGNEAMSVQPLYVVLLIFATPEQIAELFHFKCLVDPT